MFDIARWLCAALERGAKSGRSAREISLELSDRLEKLGERYYFTQVLDVFITSRFEEAEVAVRRGGAVQLISVERR